MPQCTHHQVKPPFLLSRVENVHNHYSDLISLSYHDPRGDCFSRIKEMLKSQNMVKVMIVLPT